MIPERATLLGAAALPLSQHRGPTSVSVFIQLTHPLPPRHLQLAHSSHYAHGAAQIKLRCWYEGAEQFWVSFSERSPHARRGIIMPRCIFRERPTTRRVNAAWNLLFKGLFLVEEAGLTPVESCFMHSRYQSPTIVHTNAENYGVSVLAFLI